MSSYTALTLAEISLHIRFRRYIKLHLRRPSKTGPRIIFIEIKILAKIQDEKDPIVVY